MALGDFFYGVEVVDECELEAERREAGAAFDLGNQGLHVHHGKVIHFLQCSNKYYKSLKIIWIWVRLCHPTTAVEGDSLECLCLFCPGLIHNDSRGFRVDVYSKSSLNFLAGKWIKSMRSRPIVVLVI